MQALEKSTPDLNPSGLIKPKPLQSVFVVIPALNEEDSLPFVLKEIPRSFSEGVVKEIIVVDNGSCDKTGEVAKNFGAKVYLEKKRGYGQACFSGFKILSDLVEEDPIIVFLDADFSDFPQELPRLIRPFQEEGMDFVIGSRMHGKCKGQALLPQARLGNRLACFLIRILYGYRFTDLGPFRAIRYSKLVALGMKDRNFGWTVEMQIRALQKGLKVTEVPVSYRRRIGKSKITGTIHGTLQAGSKILWTIFKLVFQGRGSDFKRLRK